MRRPGCDRRLTGSSRAGLTPTTISLSLRLLSTLSSTRPTSSKMSKKGAKSQPKETSYEVRDVVLAKVRGYPPWPGIVSTALFASSRLVAHVWTWLSPSFNDIYLCRSWTRRLYQRMSRKSVLMPRARRATGTASASSLPVTSTFSHLYTHSKSCNVVLLSLALG